MASLAPFATADGEQPTALTEVHILPGERAEFGHPHPGVQYQRYGGLIPRRAEPLDGPEQSMLLAVVQPAWAATDFPDGRGDTEPVAAAEQTHIDRPVQKTLEGGQFAV